MESHAPVQSWNLALRTIFEFVPVINCIFHLFLSLSEAKEHRTIEGKELFRIRLKIIKIN